MNFFGSCGDFTTKHVLRERTKVFPTNKHAQHMWYSDTENETFDEECLLCICVVFFSFSKMGYHGLRTSSVHSYKKYAFMLLASCLFSSCRLQTHYTFERRTIYFCRLNCPQVKRYIEQILRHNMSNIISQPKSFLNNSADFELLILSRVNYTSTIYTVHVCLCMSWHLSCYMLQPKVHSGKSPHMCLM